MMCQLAISTPVLHAEGSGWAWRPHLVVPAPCMQWEGAEGIVWPACSGWQLLTCARGVCGRCLIRHKAAQHRPGREAKPPAPVETQPECIAGVMREYQVEGLSWLVSRLGDAGTNAILADEMARIISPTSTFRPDFPV